jgi:hypothetical protein
MLARLFPPRHVDSVLDRFFIRVGFAGEGMEVEFVHSAVGRFRKWSFAAQSDGGGDVCRTLLRRVCGLKIAVFGNSYRSR